MHNAKGRQYQAGPMNRKSAHNDVLAGGQGFDGSPLLVSHLFDLRLQMLRCSHGNVLLQVVFDVDIGAQVRVAPYQRGCALTAAVGPLDNRF